MCVCVCVCAYLHAHVQFHVFFIFMFDCTSCSNFTRSSYYSKIYAQEQKDSSKSKHGTQRRDQVNLASRRDSLQLELPSENLLNWRQAVGGAMSTSQLAVSMCELENCIAWEKSNTIVVSLSG